MKKKQDALATKPIKPRNFNTARSTDHCRRSAGQTEPPETY